MNCICERIVESELKLGVRTVRFKRKSSPALLIKFPDQNSVDLTAAMVIADLDRVISFA